MSKNQPGFEVNNNQDYLKENYNVYLHFTLNNYLLDNGY